jgi:hypothetical protein
MDTEHSSSLCILKATLTYFVIVFVAGFLLGVVRVLLVGPKLGVRSAELIEMPLMLLITIASATFIVRWFAIQSIRDRLTTGFFGLFLMITAEFLLVLRVRGLTLPQYFEERDPVSGTLYYVVLILFGLMPWLIAHKKNVNGLS